VTGCLCSVCDAKGEREVKGLTTAASLLFAAGVGVSVALLQFVVAIGGTIMVLVTLRVMGWLEHLLARRRKG
jgi:putative Mg2+ transporter-C (MgtC) family protein